ncbi:hypothetical protein EB796_018496 [Bugula neritina]|uniref:Uncharacterized protein n=1 Tax=Bugula neritina TaxID=10212 RepID=A0A7J7JB51_BUGNE|nr:hypothetical protein EB796_018496 [Bugula neritina]
MVINISTLFYSAGDSSLVRKTGDSQILSDEMNSTRDSTEGDPNFVKMEPPTDIEIGLNPAEEHAEHTAEYHAEDLVVKVEVPTADVEIELEPAEQHAEHGLRSCDNRGDVC